MTGFCECGCGGRAPIAQRTRAALGYVKGQPMRFINGHNRAKPSVLDRLADLWQEEDRGYETPCWIWRGPIGVYGYGLVTLRRGEADGSRTKRAHKVVWEREYGPVPPGLELDHLCRVRACVRPDHLEAVTHLENLRRGVVARRASATA